MSPFMGFTSNLSGRPGISRIVQVDLVKTNVKDMDFAQAEQPLED